MFSVYSFIPINIYRYSSSFHVFTKHSQSFPNSTLKECHKEIIWLHTSKIPPTYTYWYAQWVNMVYIWKKSIIKCYNPIILYQGKLNNTINLAWLSTFNVSSMTYLHVIVGVYMYLIQVKQKNTWLELVVKQYNRLQF